MLCVSAPCAAYASLIHSPLAGDCRSREPGITKDASARAREALIELARLKLCIQPDSVLAVWFLSRVGSAPAGSDAMRSWHWPASC